MKKLIELSVFNAIPKSTQKQINGGSLNHLPDCSHLFCNGPIAVNPITGLCYCAED